MSRALASLLARWCLPLAFACGGDSDDGGSGASTNASSSSGAGASSSSSTSAAGGSGGSSSTSSGGAGGAGNDCASSSFTLCEDFEGAADGDFPSGWGARGDEWGQGVIGVTSSEARFGSKSLMVDGGNNGQHFMDYKNGLGSLASHHYGRVYMKVEVPAPWPSTNVLHADFIEGLGPGPNGGTHNVRWGVVENTQISSPAWA